MSEQEYQECLEAIRQDIERNQSQTREEARQQLMDEGFITKDGELTPDYR